MPIIILILGLFIYLIYEIVHYCKIKSNIISRNEVKKAAEKQARNLKINDPIISCDYCGAKIDTKIHKVCPQCGGAYDKDIEWTSKFNVKSEFIDEQTKEIIDQREFKAQKEAQAALKKIKKTIIALVVINAVIIGLGTFIAISNSSSRYRSSETIEKKFERFTKADYSIEGDGIICDTDDFKLALTGIYTENRYHADSSYYGEYVLEFDIENRTDEDVRVSLYCCGNSGLSEGNQVIFYDTFKKNSHVVIYDNIYFSEGDSDQISELIFNELEVRSNKDYDTVFKLNDPVTIKTTSDFRYAPQTEDSNLIFSNDKIDIFSVYENNDYEPGYVFTLINKTDKSFIITSNDFIIDGEEISPYIRDDNIIPTDYFFITDPLYPGGKKYDDFKDRNVKINFSFGCKQDPSLNFATGYIDLNK